MRLSAALILALVMAAPVAAQAGERRRNYHPPVYDEPQYRSEAERRAGIWRRGEPEDDTPYGPRYQTQEQEQQSMYDFSTGRRGNIKEYWWR